MDDLTRQFLINMRAALLKQARDLLEERAAILAQAAEIEKYCNLIKRDPAQPVQAVSEVARMLHRTVT